MASPRLIRIANTNEIEPGEAKAFPVEGRMIAVFNLDGEFYAIDDACPHRGASLAASPVEGDTVICCWHGWEFNIKTGRMWKSPGVRSYPVEVKDGAIHLVWEQGED